MLPASEIDLLLTRQTIACLLAGWTSAEIEWLERERREYPWNVVEETFTVLEEAHLRFQRWLWRAEVARR